MKELEDEFLSIDCEDSCCGLWVRDIFGKEYEGDIVSADFAKRLIEERNEAIFQSERAWKAVQRVQDERAESFATLSKTVGKVALTEYQPEVDLEINSRIEQIKFEKEGLKNALKSLVLMFEDFEEDDSTYENAYYSFYKGKYDIWLKARSVLENTK